MQATSTYISEKTRDSNNNIINPATEEGLDMILEAIENFTLTDSPLIQGENGELLTRDVGIERILGSNSLVSKGNLNTFASNSNDSANFTITGANSERRVSIANYSTCSIQISGTWAGTISFEVSANGADFIAIAGVNIPTNTLLQSITSNSIVRFNVSGLQVIRVRFSAYTSGIALINFSFSSGEQQQPLSQRATTFELNTFDTNLATLPTAIGTTQMYQTGMEIEGIRVIEPTVNPTQPTTYAAPKFAMYPQIFRRLRVESAGDKRLPFAQEANTNRLIVATPEVYRILEEVLLALSDIRDILKISNGVDTSQP